MTGTAKTEEEEFRKIYNMRVIQIPTNRPVQRIDDVDLVFGNSNARFKALVEEVKKRHATGQPILIGTASVEKSEIVDKLLTEAGLPHDVLNAKNHAREAAIIAEAGKKGAITIATNMAGRGTDIKIDDEVKKLGGLAVLGTERHESRRIDNQLRGRSGRQGDPGYSRFFVSLDDELMQRFGSDNLQRLFGKMGDEPLESSMVTKAITTAQKKVEGQNFDTRKNLLDYDDVLRQQREIMYKQRDTILFSDSIFDSIQKYFERAAEGLVSESIVEIDQEKVVDETKLIKLVEPKYLAPGTINPTDFHQIPADEATDFLATIMYKIYLKKRKGWSDDVANYVEKTVTLQQVDKNWTKHIDTMSKLRESIYLRSYANSNPLQAYTNEGYDLFNKMALTISDEVVNNLLHVQVRVTPQPQQPAADAEEVKEVRETPTEEPKQEEVKEENKEQN